MTEQSKIVRPRMSQLELFIIVNLLNEQYDFHKTVQPQKPYVKQLRRLRRKLKRNLKIDHANYEVTSNRVPYVKTEPLDVETKESLREKPNRENRFMAFNY